MASNSPKLLGLLDDYGWLQGLEVIQYGEYEFQVNKFEAWLNSDKVVIQHLSEKMRFSCFRISQFHCRLFRNILPKVIEIGWRVTKW